MTYTASKCSSYRIRSPFSHRHCVLDLSDEYCSNSVCDHNETHLATLSFCLPCETCPVSSILHVPLWIMFPKPKPFSRYILCHFQLPTNLEIMPLRVLVLETAGLFFSSWIWCRNSTVRHSHFVRWCTGICKKQSILWRWTAASPLSETWVATPMFECFYCFQNLSNYSFWQAKIKYHHNNVFSKAEYALNSNRISFQTRSQCTE